MWDWASLGGYWGAVNFGLVASPADGNRWRSIRKCSRVWEGDEGLILGGRVPCWVDENM